jgi:hypothetical protein
MLSAGYITFSVSVLFRDSILLYLVFPVLFWHETLQAVYTPVQLSPFYHSTIFAECDKYYTFLSKLFLYSLFLFTYSFCIFILLEIFKIILYLLVLVES